MADESWWIAMLPLLILVFLFLAAAFGVAVLYSFVGCFRACKEEPLSPKLWARFVLFGLAMATAVLAGLKGAGRTEVADESWWIAMLPLLILVGLFLAAVFGAGVSLAICGCAKACKKEPFNPKLWARFFFGSLVVATAVLAGLKGTGRTKVAAESWWIAMLPLIVLVFLFLALVFGAGVVWAICGCAKACWKKPTSPKLWSRGVSGDNADADPSRVEGD